jgi:hypothetical protein
MVRRALSRTGVCVAITFASLGTGAVAAPSRLEHVAISMPRHVKKGNVYDVTLRGYSHHRAKAWLFIDYSGCATSFAVEKHRAADEADSYRVKGRFSEISGWKSSTTGVDHACAYLVVGGGHVVARAKTSFSVR